MTDIKSGGGGGGGSGPSHMFSWAGLVSGLVYLCTALTEIEASIAVKGFVCVCVCVKPDLDNLHQVIHISLYFIWYGYAAKSILCHVSNLYVLTL
jgi:hypothetical protein